MREDASGKNVDAILGPPGPLIEAHHHSSADTWMVARQLAQAPEVVSMHAWRRLRFDRDLKVVHDEIHLDAAGQAPVGDLEGKIVVRTVGGQLVEDPVFERRPEEWRAGLERVPPGEMILPGRAAGWPHPFLRRKERRNLLNLVDHHESVAAGLDLVSQKGGVLRKAHELPRRQQVDHRGT